jgi:hypothetical protein
VNNSFSLLVLYIEHTRKHDTHTLGFLKWGQYWGLNSWITPPALFCFTFQIGSCVLAWGQLSDLYPPTYGLPHSWDHSWRHHA